MKEMSFVLYVQMIKNYLGQKKFKYSPKDRVVLALFDRSDLKDLYQLLEEYQHGALDVRSEIHREIKYAMTKFLSKHGIFNVEKVSCHIRSDGVFEHLKLSVYVTMNDDKRSLNIFKLKSPELHESLFEHFMT